MPTLFTRDHTGKRIPLRVSGEQYEKLTGVPRTLGGSQFEKFGMELGDAFLRQQLRERLLQEQAEDPKRKIESHRGEEARHSRVKVWKIKGRKRHGR